MEFSQLPPTASDTKANRPPGAIRWSQAPAHMGPRGGRRPPGREGQLVAGGGGHPGDTPDRSELMRAVTASSVHTHVPDPLLRA